MMNSIASKVSMASVIDGLANSVRQNHEFNHQRTKARHKVAHSDEYGFSGYPVVQLFVPERNGRLPHGQSSQCSAANV